MDTSEMTGDSSIRCAPPARDNRVIRRQRSFPAAVVAAFAQCGGGGGEGARRRSLGSARLGGRLQVENHNVGEGEQKADQLGVHVQVPEAAAWPSGAGNGVWYSSSVGALWRHVVRKMVTIRRTRSGSSVVKERLYYGQEDYARNFDEGDAAAAGDDEEPGNLPRSFSARYAARRRPAAGLALSDAAQAHPCRLHAGGG